MKSELDDNRETLQSNTRTWWRVLAGGLLASVVLHWIVIDWMRAAGFQGLAAGPDKLEVRLGAAKPETPPPSLPGRVAPPTPRVAPSAAPTVEQARAPVRSDVSDKQRRSSSEASGAAERGVTAEVLSLSGLRSGQRAEALVALRLVFAQLLNGSVLWGKNRDKSAMTVWCDFDAAGRLEAVRIEGADPEALLPGAVERAAARVAVPDPLRGTAFSLDLLIERGD